MNLLERSKVQLLLHYPFYSFLLMHLEQIESESIGTCGVDGKHLFYNSTYLNKLSPQECLGVLAHEVLHCALNHMDRIGNRDPQKWNICADGVINQIILKEEGLSLPKGGIIDSWFADKYTEQAYALLPDPPKIRGSLIDDHSIWKKSSGKDYDPAKWKQLVTQAATIARMAGKLPGHLETLVEDLLHPILDWKSLLRDFVISSTKDDYRWTPPNKHYLWLPAFLPSLYGSSIEIGFAIDTSGSISDDDIKEAVSELYAITQQFNQFAIHMIQCDAEIQEYTKITKYEGIIPRKVKGRGGTNFRPVLDFIADKELDISCLVYFTDGRTDDWGNEPIYPVFWLIITDIVAPFGQTVQYNP